MSEFPFRRVGASKILRCVAVLVLAMAPTASFGQAKRTRIHGFWVAGSAEVTVKADEAIVYMVIRTSGSNVEIAVDKNEQLTRDVGNALDAIGLAGKYKFSANHFNSPRAFPRLFVPPTRPYTAPYFSRAPEQTCSFEVTKHAFVNFDEEDLAAPDFDVTLARTIDTLTLVGAQQPEITPYFPQTRISGPVIFTVRDPGTALREAIRLAQEKAQALGEDVAKNSGVRITGILDARVNRPLEVMLPRQQELNVLDELQVRYYSSSKDAVTIPATFAVEYSAK